MWKHEHTFVSNCSHIFCPSSHSLFPPARRGRHNCSRATSQSCGRGRLLRILSSQCGAHDISWDEFRPPTKCLSHFFGCWSVSKAIINLITTSLVKLWPCQLVRRMVPNVKSQANKMVVKKVFLHQRLHSLLEGICSVLGGQSQIVILLQGRVPKRFAHCTCPSISNVCCREKEAKGNSIYTHISISATVP